MAIYCRGKQSFADDVTVARDQDSSVVPRTSTLAAVSRRSDSEKTASALIIVTRETQPTM
jgi:hypothetical protein